MRRASRLRLRQNLVSRSTLENTRIMTKKNRNEKKILP